MSELSRIVEGEEKDEVHDEAGPVSSLPLPASDVTSNRFAPYASSVVAEFLTDDDGQSLLDNDPDVSSGLHIPPPNVSSLSLALSRITTRFSRRSVVTFDSAAPHFIDNGGKTLPLATFCRLIDQCASLERAIILSVECFRERTNLGVLHRTLILHLRRQGRTDVWLRIDRRRAEDVSIPALALRGGRTEANDVAQLASAKVYLIQRRTARPENRMEFTSPPTLGSLRFFLQVICEELLEYHVWPENCWFLCSLLQEHLYETGRGSFVVGNHLYLGLAAGVRSQMSSLVLSTVNACYYAHSRKAHLQTLAETYDREVTTSGPAFGTLHLLALELSAVHQDLMRGFMDDDIQQTLAQVAWTILYLQRSLWKQDPVLTNGSSQLTITTLKYGIHQTPLQNQHIGPLHHARESFAKDPEKHWHLLASELVRMLRRTAVLDPDLARTCAVEAQSLITAFSPNVQRWSTSSAINKHRGCVTAIAFSPGGSFIASCSDGKSIRLYDTERDAAAFDHWMADGVVRAVRFTPVGETIVTVDDRGRLLTWSIDKRPRAAHAPQLYRTRGLDRVRKTNFGHRLRHVAFSSDGEQILGCAEREVFATIQHWNATTGADFAVDDSPSQRRDNYLSIAFSPDGTRIASGCWKHNLSVGSSVGGPEKFGALDVAHIAPEVAGEGPGRVGRWRGSEYGIEEVPWQGGTYFTHQDEIRDFHAALAEDGVVTSLAFAPDGQMLVTGTLGGRMQRWDGHTLERIGEPTPSFGRLTFPPREQYQQGTIVAFSPDGKTIAAGYTNGDIRLWDALTGETIGEPLVGHKFEVAVIAFSDDGRMIASGSTDGDVRLWHSLESLERDLEPA